MAMHRDKRVMALINVLGGIAVLGSYAVGIALHPAPGAALWGGIPDALRPLYTASMLAATAGYFAYASFLFLRVDARAVRVGQRFRFSAFNALFVLILAPSALWMPLTFVYLDQPSPALWAAIRIVLGIVGLGSLGLIGALVALRPRSPVVAYWLAVAGSVAFAFQTALLDALVWPAFFHR